MSLPAPPALNIQTRTSLLVKAIQHQYIKQVRDLLEKGCNPNEPIGPQQIRLLMIACYMKSKFKRMSVFKSLIQHDVNIELTDVDGRDCFMYACAMTSKEDVQLLLDSRMYGLYSMDNQWNTPLHICARYGNLDVLNFLLQRMAKLKLSFNQRNLDNQTPMDVAILSKNIKCVDCLCRMNGESSYSRDEITSYCKFVGGSCGRADCDRLIFGSLLKYKKYEGRSIKKSKRTYNPEKKVISNGKKSFLKIPSVSFAKTDTEKAADNGELANGELLVTKMAVYPEPSKPNITDALLPDKLEDSYNERPKIVELAEKSNVKADPVSKLRKQVFKGKSPTIDPELLQPIESKSLPKRALRGQGITFDSVKLRLETTSSHDSQPKNIPSNKTVDTEIEQDETGMENSPPVVATSERNDTSQVAKRNTPPRPSAQARHPLQGPSSNLYCVEEEDEDEGEEETDEEVENDDEEYFSDEEQSSSCTKLNSDTPSNN